MRYKVEFLKYEWENNEMIWIPFFIQKFQGE